MRRDRSLANQALKDGAVSLEIVPFVLRARADGASAATLATDHGEVRRLLV
jgi:hypothetical protein